MRVIKLAFFVALLAAWWIGWNNRGSVIAAYIDDREPTELKLAGSDGAPELGDSGPSPFMLAFVDSAPSPTGFVPSPAPVGSVTISGGTAELSGVVIADGGEPLGGASVLIERVTSSGLVAVSLTSAEDGTWAAEGLPGGRFRIRAFVPHTYRTADTAVLSLADGASRTDVALPVALPVEQTFLRIAGPEEIIVGTSGTVAVVASHHIVDEFGRLAEVPSPAASIGATVSGVQLLSAGQGIADGVGAVRFLVMCEALGSGGLQATSGATVQDFALPPCVPVPDLEAEAEV